MAASWLGGGCELDGERGGERRRRATSEAQAAVARFSWRRRKRNEVQERGLTGVDEIDGEVAGGEPKTEGGRRRRDGRQAGGEE